MFFLLCFKIAFETWKIESFSWEYNKTWPEIEKE